MRAASGQPVVFAERAVAWLGCGAMAHCDWVPTSHVRVRVRVCMYVGIKCTVKLKVKHWKIDLNTKKNLRYKY